MSELMAHVDSEVDIEVESERIMRTGALWTAAALVASALLLGPLFASGWRPSELPMFGGFVWWLGFVAGLAGIGLLMWAGCPVPAFTPEQAHAQKVFCIRVGIVLYLSGAALIVLALLISPTHG